MNENVIPINKTERFDVCLGMPFGDGEIREGEQVGIAFLRQDREMYRLKLWMFPEAQYFVAPAFDNPAKFNILSVEEREVQAKGKRTFWNRIGYGDLVGSFVRLKFHLFDREVFICLLPRRTEEAEMRDAV